ncbi:MAG TPA: nucleoside monophosphate kinase [Gammaproteobacteria bacterium]
MRIVILGPPGSGKGTQAALVCKAFGLPHIMPSELLHSERIAGPAGHENPMLEFAAKRLRRKDATPGFIIDGFPRTIQQALLLDEVLTVLKRPLQLVIRLAIDADDMIQRLAGRRRCRDCGRQFNIFVNPTRLDEQCDECGGLLHQRVDDTEDVIDNRLRVFENLSNPVVAFYRANGLLRDVPGAAPVEQVFAEIKSALQGLQKVSAAAKGVAQVRRKAGARSAAAASPEAAAEPQAEPAPKPAARPRAAPKPKPAAQPKAAPKPKASPKAKPAAKAAPQPKPAAKPKAAAKAKPAAKPKAAPQPKPAAKPKAAAKAKPAAKPKAAPKPKPAARPKAAAPAKPAAKPAATKKRAATRARPAPGKGS